MNNENPIGRVIATLQKATTTGNVRFWLEKDVRLKPFDFVRLTPNKGDEEDVGEFYAIITEIEEVSDEQNPLTGYISADFGRSDIEPTVNRITTSYADAVILFNTKDLEIPVPHGTRVHWPDEKGVRLALGIEGYNHRVPGGYVTMSGPNRTSMTIPVDLDADYLIGPEGAHLNISGISGLATKTSYVMFLMTALQQNQIKENWEQQASFIILNVKGSDLLRIDEEDTNLDQSTKNDWEKCGLMATPMENVTYFYPYSKDEREAYTQTKLDKEIVNEKISSGKAYRYFYDYETARERLHLMLEDIDDPNQTFMSCIDHCTATLKDKSTWNDVRMALDNWAGTSPDKTPVMAWRRFRRLVTPRTKNPMFTEPLSKAEERKQVPIDKILEHLKPGGVVVVDIALLPDYLQSFVVGDVISRVREAKMNNEQQLGTVILFADELNKFAPDRQARRSITGHLQEVSERGRSEGIILFGAEQFRTGVNKSVTGNAGTQVFGRTTPIEVGRDQAIKELPGNSRRVSFLRKGELVVNHTRFSAGAIKLRFPKNAYRPG